MTPEPLAVDVPLSERLRSFAKRAREYGVRATDPGGSHIETPIDWDELGAAMWAISAFEKAADLIERLAARVRELEGAAITDAACDWEDCSARAYLCLCEPHYLATALRPESHQASEGEGE